MIDEVKLQKLGKRIIEAARKSVYFKYRFLDIAIYRLTLREMTALKGVGTDGNYFCYNAQVVLQAFSKNPECIAYNFLHTILHCIFQHVYFAKSKEQEYWDLAADIAIAAVMKDMGLVKTADELEVLQYVKSQVKKFSALAIYRKLLIVNAKENGFCGLNFQDMCRMFQHDMHTLWYTEEHKRQGLKQDANANNNENSDREGDSRQNSNPGEEQREVLSQNNTEDGGKNEEWQDVAEHILMELEVFTKEQGNKPGELICNLQDLVAEKVNYASFLRKFAFLEERMKINDDEFDYIYYTYGLRLFEKMPLIEPLEYKQEYSIKDFVIALDTSGSCSGELIENFLRKTIAILKNTECFTEKVCIHIIQCDAIVQCDDVITDLSQLNGYIRNLQLHGFGGTDFRPVFAYVNELINRGKLKRMGGLIYFTDGCGTFPAQPTPYKTAFVFVERENQPEVPPWAMKVVLTDFDWEEEKRG